MAMSQGRRKDQWIGNGICQNNPCKPFVQDHTKKLFSTKSKPLKSIPAPVCAMREGKESKRCKAGGAAECHEKEKGAAEPVSQD